MTTKTDTFMRSAGLIAALTLVSRLLGLVRDCACAAVFGAGVTWDAFAFAFRVPNLFRRLFGEGALSAAFVPAFTEYLELRGTEEASRLAPRAGRPAGGARWRGVTEWSKACPRAAPVAPLLLRNSGVRRGKRAGTSDHARSGCPSDMLRTCYKQTGRLRLLCSHGECDGGVE